MMTAEHLQGSGLDQASQGGLISRSREARPSLQELVHREIYRPPLTMRLAVHRDVTAQAGQEPPVNLQLDALQAIQVRLAEGKASPNPSPVVLSRGESKATSFPFESF